jgi:ABC-type multidrug transport system ATPase subunit
MGQVSSLLAASSLRVDVAGAPAIDGLTLESRGQRVLVLGAARALFEVTAGVRDVEHGELRVDGTSPRFASRAGVAAAAPLDPPMPPRWTVFQYIWWSARLSGRSKSQAEGAVNDALERLQLLAHTSARLGPAPVTVRRATVVGAAIATGARVVLLEDPTLGVSGDVGRSFARVIARALQDQPTLLFAGRLTLDSPVVLAADEAIAIEGSKVVAQGAPAEIATRENSFAVGATGNVRAFMDALTAQGGFLRESESSDRSARFTVDLGALGTRDLLRVADACRTVVLELRPVARVFA